MGWERLLGQTKEGLQCIYACPLRSSLSPLHRLVVPISSVKSQYENRI
ncbi:MAG: hypothetical protein OCU16_05490 [Candidatus Methanospirare jalkutatii]|nr:hypothetical protein [Candidatus Methanospirare jalkutatii]